MQSAIVAHHGFHLSWPWVTDDMLDLWRRQGPVEFVQTEPGDERPVGQVVSNPDAITRLAVFGVRDWPGITLDCLKRMPVLREMAYTGCQVPGPVLDAAGQAGIRVYTQPTEGFWGESVSECGIALTLCGLRRIPQLHQAIQSNHDRWKYAPTLEEPRRGGQYCDDMRFTSGTVARKRVRIVGAGNIASRYAHCMSLLGADVAVYDPFAHEPCIHLSGARKEWHLPRLVEDADIFAPMVPLMKTTEGMITAELIDKLPRGCLVVLVTRAKICDMAAVRRRVLADELALAADVFDVEPLPLDDPLLGRHNVVHTPHIAGRTRHANERFAEKLAEQFLPVH